MIVVAHRRNTLAELAATPTHLGVEMDVRTRGDRLVVAHDPFQDGPDLADWLDRYEHRLLIVNVKEEGVEALVLPELARHGIAEFFLLDLTFPALHRTLVGGERRCAVRVSEFERLETAIALAGRAEWAWVDGFHGFPLDAAEAGRLASAGYRHCLVSPELHGRSVETLDPYRRAARASGLRADAVCTRLWDRWA